MSAQRPRRDYPLNQWYAAAYADEVTRKPLARTICDRQIVLYRTEAGGAVGLADRCPHRKAPLSAGQLIGDRIECPFHGMQFAPSGQCVLIPAQDHIPPAAHIRAYAVAERHGLVWLWPGERAPDHAAIPDMHWLTDPALTAVKGMFTFKCNYLTALDNLIDDSHLSFVHRRSIGTPKIVNAPASVRGGDGWVGFSRWTLDTPPSAFHARAGGFTTNVDRWFEMRFVRPATVLIDVGSAPVGSGAPQGDRSRGINIFSNHSVTPATPTSCHYFWHAARNFAIGNDQVSRQIFADMHATFVEDQEIVELVQRNQDCDADNAPFLNTAVDNVCVRARRIIEAMIAEENAPEKARTA